MTDVIPTDIREGLAGVLERQRSAFMADGPPSIETRTDRIDRAIALLVDNRERIVEALELDFGHRSPEFSALSDVAGVIQPLKYAKEHLAEWMAPQERTVNPPLDQFGATARIEYQPIGVVGVVAPWNAPVRLVFQPLSGILAAGNRAVIKPSELTPACSELLAEIISAAYDESEIAVVTGGPEVAAAFVSLPFDHLIFTGGTHVGRQVMRAAAANLVPVTLELGGKCPAIIGRSADRELAASRIMTGKLLNAGQACIAPDYVLVPQEQADEYVELLERSVAEQYPTLLDNPDYTSVINQRHFERLSGYVEDARAKGARVIEVNPAGEDFSHQSTHKLPPTLVVEPTDDMTVMQEEVFGPVLPVQTYRTIDEAIGYVNAHPRPLALYYFGHDTAETQRVLSRTTSGNVTVNDVIMHTTVDDLPFGGVGASGMGSYRGIDGFRTFSHAKGIFNQSNQDIAGMAGLRPPFDERLRAALDFQIQR